MLYRSNRGKILLLAKGPCMCCFMQNRLVSLRFAAIAAEYFAYSKILIVYLCSIYRNIVMSFIMG